MLVEKYDWPERLREIIDAVADEIRDHGFDHLWGSDSDRVTGCTITVNIDVNMCPEIIYEKSTLVPNVKRTL